MIPDKAIPQKARKGSTVKDHERCNLNFQKMRFTHRAFFLVTAVKECVIFIRKSLDMALLQAKGHSFDNAERTRDYARVRRRARAPKSQFIWDFL